MFSSKVRAMLICNGTGADEFARMVDRIPTSILHPAGAELRPELFEPLVDGLDVPAKDNSHLARPLIFLARYRDFHALYARGERFEAAALLVKLLTSVVAPRRFWAILLLDAVPLLEGVYLKAFSIVTMLDMFFITDEHVLFSMHDTYELLRCLEDIVGPIAVSGHDGADVLGPLARLVTRRDDDKQKPEQTRLALRQLGIVRQALARHLARCCTLGRY